MAVWVHGSGDVCGGKKTTSTMKKRFLLYHEGLRGQTQTVRMRRASLPVELSHQPWVLDISRRTKAKNRGPSGNFCANGKTGKCLNSGSRRAGEERKGFCRNRETK